MHNELSLQELVELGAKTLLVPGNLPIGCVPAYLTTYKSDKMEDYEPETGCIHWMNEFSQYHNKLLVDELENLRKLHAGVVIIYADYYGAAMEIFSSPEQFGEFKASIFITMRTLCMIQEKYLLTNIPVSGVFVKRTYSICVHSVCCRFDWPFNKPIGKVDKILYSS